MTDSLFILLYIIGIVVVAVIVLKSLFKRDRDNKKSRIEVLDGVSLPVELSCSNQCFVVCDDTFGIYGTGQSKEAAIEDFKESFHEFYSDIMDCPEDGLPDSARKFRKEFMEKLKEAKQKP